MSEQPVRKASANKNIKKLRAISAVCSLTSSWQKWVSDNETKQASEPSGWSPASLGGPEEKPKKTWVPKKPPPEAPKEAPTPRGATRAEEVKPEPLSLIKTKQVVKTVTSSVQEKSAGVGLLTEKIQKERPASGEEIDKLLKKKRSPTRRRKCSNMVSSLTKSWKQVETEQKAGKDGGRTSRTEDERSGGRTSRTEDGGQMEVEKKLDMDDGGSGGSGGGRTSRTEVEKKLDMEDKQKANFNREEEEMSSEEDSAVRIKRPSAPLWYKKEAEDANKINILSKKFSAVGNLKSRWQTWASEHSVGQKLNPFSEYFDYDYSMSLRLQKGQEGYGRPKEGTRTAERAKRAEQHIHREIDDMCYVIRTMADPDPDGKTRVTFGQLFDRYVRISDKVVGILMRARKHGKVAFEGEMLWQGQDDAVIITLLV
ncbi:actin binding Rho activating protein b [Acanthochromis polyacanthus]|uniref:actin binding Rho activating protein b n=1 Tax=Acanthochromis polyacanthus TaxID=80966 RepID=UPI0022341A5B|nr:actin binding Rho activating protein b [Acanthochromis polyacanthus]